MGFATILPRSSIRIHVYPGVKRVPTAEVVFDAPGIVLPRCGVSVPIGVISIRIPVSVSVPSTVRLGNICACSRAARMSGLSVVILWSDFAMPREGKKGNPCQPKSPDGWTTKSCNENSYLAVCCSGINPCASSRTEVM